MSRSDRGILMGSAFRVVTPSQAFTRKISRLFVAVAIFYCGTTLACTTARDDELRVVLVNAVKLLVVSLLPWKARVLQRTLEPGPSWRLYCTLRRLPLEARRWLRSRRRLANGN